MPFFDILFKEIVSMSLKFASHPCGNVIQRFHALVNTSLFVEFVAIYTCSSI